MIKTKPILIRMLRNPDLKPSEFAVLFALLGLEENGQCTVTTRQLAKDANVSQRTVSRAVKTLTQRGYVTVKRDYDQQTGNQQATYTLNPNILVST